MTVRWLPALLIVLLSGCAAVHAPAQWRPAGHQPEEEAAVLVAADRFFKAISEQDHASLAAMQVPEGITYQWRPAGDGRMHITVRPIPYWSDPGPADKRVLRERYWSPSVMIRGGIAVVWAPYEFWVDGKTSHCGVDVLDFIKRDGQWRLANAMWTVEPDACSALRPADASLLRPRGEP